MSVVLLTFANCLEIVATNCTVLQHNVLVLLVTGPYLRRIICDELEASEESIINAVPKDDFDGKWFIFSCSMQLNIAQVQYTIFFYLQH